MSAAFDRIFLLSHMRAFTSLAGHILGSHPRINGYFELHLSYETPAALTQQLEVYQQYEALKESSRYIFDKLLHNDYLLKPEQLGFKDIKILIALRQPEQTIKSIVNLFTQRHTNERYASPLEAAKYTIERMNWLTEFSRTLGCDYYYFDAELFQEAPEVLLPRLTNWLELDSPLRDRYEVFSQTGSVRKGDSSTLIKSGKISKSRQDYSHIEIPDELYQHANAVYRECREQILANAADSATH